jgi:hypothetical protein
VLATENRDGITGTGTSLPPWPRKCS